MITVWFRPVRLVGLQWELLFRSAIRIQLQINTGTQSQVTDSRAWLLNWKPSSLYQGQTPSLNQLISQATTIADRWCKSLSARECSAFYSCQKVIRPPIYRVGRSGYLYTYLRPDTAIEGSSFGRTQLSESTLAVFLWQKILSEDLYPTAQSLQAYFCLLAPPRRYL
jgi:hypothetical protein